MAAHLKCMFPGLLTLLKNKMKKHGTKLQITYIAAEKKHLPREIIRIVISQLNPTQLNPNQLNPNQTDNSTQLNPTQLTLNEKILYTWLDFPWSRSRIVQGEAIR